MTDIDKLIQRLNLRLASYIDSEFYLPLKEELKGTTHSLGFKKERLKEKIESELENLKKEFEKDKQMDEELTKKIENISTGTKDVLNEDNVAMIIHLESNIHRLKYLIDIIKKGDIVAVYEGDRTKSYDLKEFTLKTKNEMAKEGEINDEIDTEAKRCSDSNKDRERIVWDRNYDGKHEQSWTAKTIQWNLYEF